MSKFLVFYACLVFISACTHSGRSEVCRSQVDEEFLASVSKVLKDRNVKHTFNQGQLCYEREEYFEFSRAIAFVQSYRKAVGTIVKSKDMEQKILNWLTSTSKGFQITNYDDGRRFLIIYSRSEEDVISNRKTLSLIEAGENVSF